MDNKSKTNGDVCMKLGYLALLAYAATIPAANWMIGHIGQCIENGPCLLPVGFGLMAPSGVLMVGAALFLRDAVHSSLGAKWAIGAIGAGAALSYALSPAALVIASVAAFLLSELADLVVYSPLRKNRLVLAVLLSGLVGSIVDSAVFLWLAFGSIDFIAGQVLGKLWMTIGAAGIAMVINKNKRLVASNEH
jgi:uncharacterized PurR-regulated membrane protein YhhQ (DUF165 family)